MILAILVGGMLVVTGEAAANASSEKAALVHSTDVIRFFDNHGWMVAKRHDKCREVPWQRTCTIARKLVRLHTEKIKNNFFSIANTGNWTRAVRYTQKPYPGTDDWLFYISNRECRACYTVDGGFVCNYGGSGACGPMQFMSGTFYGHMDNARADLAARGFIVPSEVWDWHNALGQALVAGYMRYTHQDGCHWCL